jgi:hypothetical protein
VKAGVFSKLKRSVSIPLGKSCPVRGQRTMRTPKALSAFWLL